MKSIINKVLVLTMTVVFVVASVGINVFSHFCSHCHMSHYSVDVAPVEFECQCDSDCACHCNENSKSESSCKNHRHTSNGKCTMHSHEHEFYHIDDSFNTPEKFSGDNFFLIAFLTNYFKSFNVETQSLKPSYIFFERLYIPDLIRLNCTMLC